MSGKGGGKGDFEEEQRPINEQLTQETAPPHMEPTETNAGWWKENGVVVYSASIPIVLALIGIWMYKLKMKESQRQREEEEREDEREDKEKARKADFKKPAKKKRK